MRQKTEMLHFRVTPQELERIRQKKEELGIRNMGAYLRKMAMDGEMYEKETLEYIRLLGLVNCRLAKMASEVVEVVYGIPVMRKGAEA